MNENAIKTIRHSGVRKISVGTRWGTAAGYTVAIAFIMLSVGYIYYHREDFNFISNISAPYLILAGIAQLLCFPIGALQLRLLLRHHGICMPCRELIAVTMSIFLGNLLLPMRGGTGGAAFYLKEIHGLSLVFFGVIFTGAALLSVLVNTGLALCGFIILYLQYGFFEPALSIAVSCLFAACFFLCIFPPSVKYKGSVLLRPVTEAISSWHALSRDRELLFKLTLLMALISVAIACCFYFLYRSIGSPLSIEAALITSTLGNLATLIPGVPGSFGIFDAVVVKIPQLFGLDTTRSLCAALIYRLIFFSCATTLGVPGILYLAAIIRSRRTKRMTP